MSRTLRKDRNNNIHSDGKPLNTSPYICNCSYCTGVDRNKLLKTILNRELKKELETIGV
jgi:hypothetical protein